MTGSASKALRRQGHAVRDGDQGRRKAPPRSKRCREQNLKCNTVIRMAPMTINPRLSDRLAIAQFHYNSGEESRGGRGVRRPGVRVKRCVARVVPSEDGISHGVRVKHCVARVVPRRMACPGRSRSGVRLRTVSTHPTAASPTPSDLRSFFLQRSRRWNSLAWVAWRKICWILPFGVIVNVPLCFEYNLDYDFCVMG
ncbi:hypothetical protein DICVIV_07056 [Dictyocaulus viviparus]|uniref:Uncharacterized protein n=1 Tax=Dictyocaulus viviparus TaxID=29172 RepID=A0A0D8XST3_DICVI|nr:hypothetical protein DICVIV_07056 [Dictyocaulus viviparus]